MARTSPPPASRRGPAATAALLLATALGAIATAPALAAPAPTAPAGGDLLHGTVQRLSVERQSGGSRSGEITAWLDAPGGHVPLDPAAVVGVPTGTAVAVRLGPVRAGQGDAVRAVRSLAVVTPAPSTTAEATPPQATGARATGAQATGARATGARATGAPRVAKAAVHGVTLVLALPGTARADATTPARLSAAAADAARFWSARTDGRIAFAVTRAVGWTHLQHGCDDVWGMWDEARARIGFVPGPDRHLLLYVPPGAGCASGLGTVSPSVDAGGYVLVAGSTTGLLAHELGHNLGLGHSDALSCDGVADGTFVEGWSDGCTHEDYGDWYDVMGISWDNIGSLSTAQAYRLGVLDGVLAVSGPTRAVLRPVSGRAGVRSLRVTDPDGAVYVVEYRPASGADSWLGTASDWRGLRPGVLVRRIDPQDPTRILLLDATPSPSALDPADHDEPLRPGQSFRTASGRVTIRLESQVAGAATVVVDRDGVSPADVVQPGGRLVNGRQVTIGDAPAAWAAAGR